MREDRRVEELVRFAGVRVHEVPNLEPLERAFGI